jgi:hypothetical protein
MMFSLWLELITHHIALLTWLAGFRPQQLAVAIHTTPVAINESHWLAAHGALGRRSLVDDRELR